MFTMCNAALNACWDNATVRCHLSEQWLHDKAGQHPLPYRTEFINFSERDLINDNEDSSFYLLILSAINLQCHVVFSFWKAFVKCPSLSVNGIFDDVRYGVGVGKSSTGLHGWSDGGVCSYIPPYLDHFRIHTCSLLGSHLERTVVLRRTYARRHLVCFVRFDESIVRWRIAQM